MRRSILVAVVACLTFTMVVAGEAFGRGGGGGGSRGGGGGGASRGSVRYSGGSTPAARPSAPAARPSTPAARPATQPIVPKSTAQGRPPGTTPARDASGTAVNRAQLSNGMRNNNAASTLPANTSRIRTGEYPNYGSRVSTLPTNSVTVNARGTSYGYAGGTYYAHGDNGWVVCRPPIYCHVPALPIGHYPYWYANRRYYYYGGAYYVESGTEYEVVDPPVGSVVDDLPPGAKEVQIGGKTYYDDNGTIYEAVMVDGEVAYRVVDLH